MLVDLRIREHSALALEQTNWNINGSSEELSFIHPQNSPKKKEYHVRVEIGTDRVSLRLTEQISGALISVWQTPLQFDSDLKQMKFVQRRPKSSWTAWIMLYPT